MILSEYDNAKTAILNPDFFWPKKEGFPKTVLSIFSSTLFKETINTFEHEIIGEVVNATLDFPIYKLNIKGREIACYQSPVGAPACVAIFEEVMSHGAKNILLVGNCGCLDSKIKDLSIIIPTAAIRDEGTSYHYLPEADEIEIDRNIVEIIKSTTIEKNMHFEIGKTWTTDAIFRETKEKTQRRKNQGAIAVEMECAAMAAASKFRGFNFGQILYAADNLASDEYDPRSLVHNSINSEKQQIISLAAECVIKIDEKY